MSNFSNIGFGVDSMEAFEALAKMVHHKGRGIPVGESQYVRYTDPSGAELWLQINAQGEIIGMNPHFDGESRFSVALTATILREDSVLDGAFHGWASPADAKNPESGLFPFVFDMPDAHLVPPLQLPVAVEVQLCAFAGEIAAYPDEKAYDASQTEEIKMAAESFIPIGLFGSEGESPHATARFAGTVTRSERKRNTHTGAEFFWMLVRTLGGEVDIVVDPRLLGALPLPGHILIGDFWMSGRVVAAPKAKRKKGFLERVFWGA